MLIFLLSIEILGKSMSKSSFESKPTISSSEGNMEKSSLQKDVKEVEGSKKSDKSLLSFNQSDLNKTEVENMTDKSEKKDQGNVSNDILEQEMNAELNGLNNVKAKNKSNLSTENMFTSLGDGAVKTSAQINNILQELTGSSVQSGTKYLDNKASMEERDILSKKSRDLGNIGGIKENKDGESLNFNSSKISESMAGSSGSGGSATGGGFSGTDLKNFENERGINKNSFSKSSLINSNGGSAFESNNNIIERQFGEKVSQRRRDTEGDEKNSLLLNAVIKKEAEYKRDLNSRSFSKFSGDSKIINNKLGYQAINGEEYVGGTMHTFDENHPYDDYIKTSAGDINEMARHMSVFNNKNTNYIAGRAILAGKKLDDKNAKEALRELAGAAKFSDQEAFHKEQEEIKAHKAKEFKNEQFFAGNFADFLSAALNKNGTCITNSSGWFCFRSDQINTNFNSSSSKTHKGMFSAESLRQGDRTLLTNEFPSEETSFTYIDGNY
ncbi:hypothetical protein H311_03298 [Anncaliia algerae PRA109]|nr:hypothetical protein H311_03298 [Anncaliia algerae PRA109]